MQAPASLDRFRSTIDEAIFRVLNDRPGPLFGMMRHHLGWEDGALIQGGKYLRPTLALVTAEACGGNWEDALLAAVGLELLHNFSLIHDDIQDESSYRRNRPTVWSTWGTSQAINAGDAMHALSQLVVLRMVEDGAPPHSVLHAIRMLDETCLALCEGQTEDIDFENRADVTADDYKRMIGNKTAEAFRCALEIGSAFAGGSAEQGRQLGEAGFEMGIAFQIHDDVLDIWGGEIIGKETALDIRDGKKSLPVIYGLTQADSPDADRLREMYRTGFGPDAVGDVVSLLESLGASDFCAAEADVHWAKGRAMIESAGLPENGAAALIEIGEYLITRPN